MTEQETVKFLTIISECYPHFMDGKNPMVTRAIWQKFFADDPYPLVEAGLMAYINKDSKGFPPAVGQIRKEMGIMTRKDDMTEAEAWAMVRKAISNGIYGYNEEFAKFPSAVKAAVGSARMLHEWAMEDEDVVNSVIASNFQRAFRAKAEYQREYEAIPAGVRQALLEFTGNLGKIGDGSTD